MRKILEFLILLPLLCSCQQYNNPPFDTKEKFLRQFPIEKSKTMVLDSVYDKRDSLTYLRLKNLEIIMMFEVSEIPDWIGGFNQLKIFQVINDKNRKIKKIPTSLGKLPNLTELNFNNNYIESIPNSFYRLKKMKLLKLENNKIDSISPLIGKLQNLQSLNLASNPIKNIPEEICNIKSVETLSLENTELKELPKCLGNLQNLDWINVSGTQLTEFPHEILNAPNLETVDAKGLKLKNYKEIKSICEKKNITFYYDEN